MHAVVVTVTINDRDAAETELREQLVPWASHTPQFVTGYWTIKDDNGLTMLMYETEDAANRMSEQVSHAGAAAALTDQPAAPAARCRADASGRRRSSTLALPAGIEAIGRHRSDHTRGCGGTTKDDRPALLPATVS
jgi:hypothetical protein